jgi:hypothetical protein
MTHEFRFSHRCGETRLMLYAALLLSRWFPDHIALGCPANDLEAA